MGEQVSCTRTIESVLGTLRTVLEYVETLQSPNRTGNDPSSGENDTIATTLECGRTQAGCGVRAVRGRAPLARELASPLVETPALCGVGQTVCETGWGRSRECVCVFWNSPSSPNLGDLHFSLRNETVGGRSGAVQVYLEEDHALTGVRRKFRWGSTAVDHGLATNTIESVLERHGPCSSALELSKVQNRTGNDRDTKPHTNKQVAIVETFDRLFSRESSASASAGVLRLVETSLRGFVYDRACSEKDT